MYDVIVQLVSESESVSSEPIIQFSQPTRTKPTELEKLLTGVLYQLAYRLNFCGHKAIHRSNREIAITNRFFQ